MSEQRDGPSGRTTSVRDMNEGGDTAFIAAAKQAGVGQWTAAIQARTF
ncbi:MAG: hypothetical protein QNJ44_05595 [Rhodobacter sp.]|nr:hypothetical protein [Rhodobacter sp.]